MNEHVAAISDDFGLLCALEAKVAGYNKSGNDGASAEFVTFETGFRVMP